ncbi:uncharacterized protein HMPREF1541_03796 [Cyphellophora europaea CBS 101466]|uniref:Zn(2)-C6 fungal-type domain-containing protein n=1 Tax=Cyphellophora europaea (strain CBS 101466) TaxID=1220924 RepID=W2RZJ0_CYPE1|nr:uncharacterized protein HMPREF1541_03796 [Cyphellophora europaea CBS 101466]ETN41857.1 hypothetical protein HMPREF1541_03796 [Cyphellophora europaea CBS 101466]
MAVKQPGKSIAFELLLDESSKTRARIPLRVLVNAHDTTESIIATVKNFYGIYDGHGISFEDSQGNTLIASYENLAANTTFYVRTVPGSNGATPYPSGPFAVPAVPEPQRQPSLGEPFQMLPPHMREQSHSPSRSSSRLARKRSVSPSQNRGRRSVSQQKPASFSAVSRGSSASGNYSDDNGYSDSEAGRSSVSGSRRAKSEMLASSDISTANVLQDGRRGQTIFDSSTLPLFVPPQVPIAASQSSISPQRRSLLQEGPSPFQPPAQKLFGQPPPMLSPQSHNPRYSNGSTDQYSATGGFAAPQHRHHLRDRMQTTPYTGRAGYSGILPTPDPTVASCISDEDVARTLIALGDASNYSHGRTSNSTMDETFSGAADAASSTGATSDSDEYSDEEGGQPKHRRYLDEGEVEYDTDGHIKSEFDDFEGAPKTKKIKTKMHDGPTHMHGSGRAGSHSKNKSKPRQGPMNKPTKPSLAGSMPAPRKASSASSTNMPAYGVDEEDLSTKPRCQRCRKSKKGCDRQRPCQRCKDAGIGPEGCVSEDEGNGRRGRFGRHMGVPVKKTSLESLSNADDSLMLPPMAVETVAGMGSPSKDKKRKR